MDEDDFRRRADPGVIDISNLVGSYSRENIGTFNSDSSLVSRDMVTTWKRMYTNVALTSPGTYKPGPAPAAAFLTIGTTCLPGPESYVLT